MAPATPRLQFFGAARLKPVRDGEWLRLGDIEVHCHYNGHIPGSRFLEVVAAGRRLLFSGDLGRPRDPLMKPPEPPTPTDYLIVESTDGDRLHPAVDVEEKLAAIVRETVGRNGSVLIPAFAVGRAETVLFLLRKLPEQRRIPPQLPIHLDSPMAVSVTDLFRRFHPLHKLSAEECELMCRQVHYVRSVEQPQALNRVSMPRIIVSARGARVANLDTLSAHADYEEILQWLAKLPAPPRRTLVTHGEPAAADAMRLHLQEAYGWPATAPDYGDAFTLQGVPAFSARCDSVSHIAIRP